MDSQKKITLKSSDGETFEVEESVARKSQLIKDMIEDDCADNVIPLPKVDSNILTKVIEYCKKHVETPNPEGRADEEEIKSWDAEFVEVDKGTLFGLINAANYLNIKSLFYLTTQKAADMIKGKTGEEIREFFNMEKLTPEGEEEARKENNFEYTARNPNPLSRPALSEKMDDVLGREVGIDAGEEDVAGRATKSSPLEKIDYIDFDQFPVSAMDLIELEKEMEVDVGEEEERFLCVSHGAAIYCLDLKRGEVGFNTAPQSLPVVHKFDLCEGDSCPISIGLLKFGPDVLVVKGSDPQIYQLRLVDGFLRISPLYTFPKLRTPKEYPIMERVGNEIHVMESCPVSIQDGMVIPTHEVLDPNNADSEVVSPMQHANGSPIVMRGHLLLGDQIFATAHHTHYNKFYVLDCKTKKWELREWPWTETHLASYLSYESPICVDRFYKTGCEAPFCLINFGNNWPWFEEKRGMVSAEAVGVMETGYVRWSQALPQFFEGLEPMYMWYAHVFRTDKRTMCVIIRGYQYVGGDGSNFDEKFQDVLYIATFYVEESSKWEKGCIEVVLKERYIYKVERDDFSPRLRRMSACFLKYEVADMVKRKTTEEIRKFFNIKNNLTPEEEEEARRENHGLSSDIWKGRE